MLEGIPNAHQTSGGPPDSLVGSSAVRRRLGLGWRWPWFLVVVDAGDVSAGSRGTGRGGVLVKGPAQLSGWG